MSTVQQKIQAIEDKKYRDLLIKRENRDMRVSQMFEDARNLALYGPYANIISSPETMETLMLPDPEASEASDEKTADLFIFHMETLSGGDKVFAQNMLNRMYDGGYDLTSISFINASIANIKEEMRKQFKGGRTDENAIFFFLKRYVQTYDSNNDGIKDELDEISKKGFGKPEKISYIQDLMKQNPEIIKIVDNYLQENKVIRISESFVSMTKTKQNKIPAKDINELFKNIMEDYPYEERAIDTTADAKDVQGGRLKKRRVFNGSGILGHGISDKMYVDTTHLNKDSLCLKYKSTKKIIGKCQPVNQEQKDSIMALIKGNYSKRQYDKLRSGSKELIHDFAIASKAQNVEFITHSDALLNKHQVIIGEIQAGNDSDELRRLLKLTTTELLKIKQISKLEALSILSQLE